jgi:predicted metal-dependent phosphoesterase TrpH
MLKIDLHTHSTSSPDGSISLEQYRETLNTGQLDVIAITDHDTIAFATKAQKELGKERIIVGEEITTMDGEIIGLYLKEEVRPGLSAIETIQVIKNQGGLVHIPHPFETVRKGIQLNVLNEVAEFVDSIEAPNGRSLQPKDEQTIAWAREHNVAVVAASDAHRAGALGKTYTSIQALPRVETLLALLKDATMSYKRPSIGDILAPKINRLRKKFR